MKDKKKKIGQKGVTGIEVSIIGAIALFTIVLTVIIPIIFLKIHLVRVVEIQYGYNNAGLTLLALLSDSDIYGKLSLYVAGVEDNMVEGFTRAATEGLLISRLDKLVPSGCYKISYSDNTIVDTGECGTEYTTSAYIALPYGRGVEQVTLDILTGLVERPEFTRYCCYEPFAAGKVCETIDGCDDMVWEIDIAAECRNPTTDCYRNRE